VRCSDIHVRFDNECRAHAEHDEHRDGVETDEENARLFADAEYNGFHQDPPIVHLEEEKETTTRVQTTQRTST
jgi:hypothetical protein